MDKDKLQRMRHDFGQRELKVLEETMAQPMREHLLKRGLSQKEIDQVFHAELDKHK